MKVLVIGGTGFIGAHVVNQLVNRGHTVAVFHRGSSADSLPEPVVSFRGDRRSLASHAASLTAFGADAVIDMILSSGRQAREMLDVFRGRVPRIVAVSSMDVYRACGVLHGLEPGPLEPVPLMEGSALRTRLQTYPLEQVRALQQVFGWLDDEYDKIPVEEAILGDQAIEGRIVRLPMVYGPRDPLHRVGSLLRRFDTEDPILFEERAARWRSSRGYVENVALAIVLVAESGKATYRIYNAGEMDSLSELEWAHEVARAARWPGKLATVPSDMAPARIKMPGNLDQPWVVDSTRIRRELGFREVVERDQALERACAWERTMRS